MKNQKIEVEAQNGGNEHAFKATHSDSERKSSFIVWCWTYWNYWNMRSDFPPEWILNKYTFAAWFKLSLIVALQKSL